MTTARGLLVPLLLLLLLLLLLAQTQTEKHMIVASLT